MIVHYIWRIFTKSLGDKPRKRDRCESPNKGVKELIMDKISDFVSKLSACSDDLLLHVLLGLVAKCPIDVSLINFALIKSTFFACAISPNLFISSLSIHSPFIFWTTRLSAFGFTNCGFLVQTRNRRDSAIKLRRMRGRMFYF